MRHGVLTSQLNIAWIHDFDIEDRAITARFAGSPGTSFTLEGRDVQSDGIRLGGALTFAGRKAFTVSVSLNAEFREDYTDLAGLFQAHGKF